MSPSSQGDSVVRGRSCPLAYRYRPEDLTQPASLACQTLYVVGGLYGNEPALRAILDRARDEPTTPLIVFNGDFHYLDVEPQTFGAINDAVLAHHAIRGNIEAQLADPDNDAGCGCDYPDYIDDATVERSNHIVARLQHTARRAGEVARLASLPRYLAVDVAGQRVGIVHGDLESLAGWRLALEAMEPGDTTLRTALGWTGTPTTPAVVADWLQRAQLRVIASTHTGLPYAQDYRINHEPHLVINNGCAGLPNFHDTTHGVITRISTDPKCPNDSLYGINLGPLRCDALPIHFNIGQWNAYFLRQWPPGTPAHTSYYERLTHGTQLDPCQVARGNVSR